MAKLGLLTLGLVLGSCAALQLRLNDRMIGWFDQPRIATYVINRDDRPDRCNHMENQFAKAPDDIMFQRVPPAGSGCVGGGFMGGGHGNEDAERSLFCTNKQIWEEASKRNDTDFIVIFEDDTVLSENFWTEVKHLLKDCQAVNYIAVDTTETDGNGNFVDTCSKEGFPNLEKMSGMSAHTQIIRKDHLHRLIEKANEVGGGAMDLWNRIHLQGDGEFAWRPGLSRQGEVGPSNIQMHKHTKSQDSRLGCP